VAVVVPRVMGPLLQENRVDQAVVGQVMAALLVLEVHLLL